MDVTAYLDRIAYRGALTPNADTLRALHLAHLQTIPFENLDIHLSRPILLDLERLFQKIVVQRRGGFCYELNGLFAELLRAVGFQVTYLSARDAHPDGSYGPEYDHLTLLVQTAEDDHAHVMTDWLADVGWGDTFCVPLRLDRYDVQVEGARAYRLEHTGINYILWQRQYSGDWEQNYRFTLEPRQYADFEPMCQYHQTSPHSLFTQQRLCTKATPEGRITLDPTRLITTIHGQRQERTLLGEDEFWALARLHFDIEVAA
jgi:N-hydroxyarylamine O-acetyltransferase